MKIGLILSCFLFIITLTKVYAISGAEILAEHHALAQISDINFVEKYGVPLLDKTQKFFNSFEGDKFLTTPEGKKLLNSQKKLRNALFIRKELNGCSNGKEKRNLGERIAQSALAFNPTEDCNDSEMTHFQNGLGPLMELAKDMKNIQKEAFFNDVWQTTMRNTLMTKAAHELKYGITPNTPVARKKLIEDLIQEGCKDGNIDACNQVTKAQLTKDLTRYVEETSKTIKPQTAEQVTNTINTKLKIFNQKLKSIEIKTTAGIKIPVLWDGDSADLENLAQNSALKDYQLSYQNFVSNNEGLLTFSDTIEDKLGKMRSVDEDLMDKDKKGIGKRSVFSFKQYPMLTEDDSKEAIKEIHEDVTKHIKELKKNLLIPNLFDDLGELRHFVEYSPVAVAESLMEHPENVKLVCESLQHIKRREESKEETLKVAKWGGMIVGVGLMATGIGAGAGAAIFAGSAGAGTAAAVATTSFALGTGVGVATAGVSTYEAVDAYIKQDNLKASSLTNNIDVEGMAEYSEALEEFKKARFEAGLNLGFAALDLGLLKAVSGVGKVGINAAKELKMTTEAMKKASQFYETLRASKSGVKLAEAFKPVVNGAKKMDEFLMRLSQSSEKLRLKFLDRLKDSKFTPEKIRKMAEESLEASKKCLL